MEEWFFWRVFGAVFVVVIFCWVEERFPELTVYY